MTSNSEHCSVTRLQSRFQYPCSPSEYTQSVIGHGKQQSTVPSGVGTEAQNRPGRSADNSAGFERPSWIIGKFLTSHIAIEARQLQERCRAEPSLHCNVGHRVYGTFCSLCESIDGSETSNSSQIPGTSPTLFSYFFIPLQTVAPRYPLLEAFCTRGALNTRPVLSSSVVMRCRPECPSTALSNST